jgi:hypothetical protein
VRNWQLKPGTVREPRGMGMSVVGSRYQGTTIEDMTVDASVCVKVSCKV